MSEFKKLENLLKQGKLTRREFLARVSALGLMAAVSPALLSKKASAATPQKGGRLIIGSPGGATTDNLDPRILVQLNPQLISSQLRSCLIEIDHNMKPIPELAESWEPTPDAKKWIVKLRKGVEFHNGKTFDAKDVIYSYNIHRAEDSNSAAKGYLDQIKDIQTDGKHTVVFNLKGGNADFPYILSAYHLAIVPDGETDFEKGVGTGPYKLENWEPGVRTFATRNPNYFKEGRAHFDEVETIVIVDPVARTTALKTGDIHVMSRPDRKTVALLETASGLQVIKCPGMQHFTIPMHTKYPPYDNLDVRLGLKYAVDREQMVEHVLRGYGDVGNDHPISKINRYYNTELPQRKYDPDKARYHIKKAGMLDHTFTHHTAETAFPQAIDASVLFSQSAEKAGIKIKVNRLPNDGYWENDRDFSWSYWSGRPTEDWMFSMVYAGEAPWNDTDWQHERFNKLLKEGRAELDDSKRKEMYWEMQRIVRDEGATIIPIYVWFIYPASDKLAFENVASNLELDGLRIAERWWFKS